MVQTRHISHTPHERFIWGKGSMISSSQLKNRSGDNLINYYEDYIEWWISGDPIPDEIVNSSQYLDFVAPTVYKTTYYITEDTYSDIDWGTYITPYDDYTNSDDIKVNEIYDNVIYTVPGTYYVKIELIDLVGNKREKILTVYVRDISPC